MSVIDQWGIKLVVARRQRTSTESIERARDLTIVRLRASGLSWRQIEAFFTPISDDGARLRWHAIPEEVRRHYGQAVG